MIFSAAIVVLAALAAENQVVSAQYPTTFGPNGNVAPLTGTWSSGAGLVLTGVNEAGTPYFANPTNRSFNYPPVAGVAYSFTEDNHFEYARYRFIGNGSEPTCIKGVIGWGHGTWQSFPNGTIHLYPWEDAFQQIQDPCAPVSNFIENYNGTEYYSAWQVYQDTTRGLTARLYQHDGQPLPPMHYRGPPNMMPLRLLANATGTASEETASGGERRLFKRSGAERQSKVTWMSVGAAALSLVGASVVML